MEIEPATERECGGNFGFPMAVVFPLPLDPQKRSSAIENMNAKII